MTYLSSDYIVRQTILHFIYTFYVYRDEQQQSFPHYTTSEIEICLLQPLECLIFCCQISYSIDLYIPFSSRKLLLCTSLSLIFFVVILGLSFSSWSSGLIDLHQPSTLLAYTRKQPACSYFVIRLSLCYLFLAN